MVKTLFGYEEENRTLKMFLLRLMLTDYAHHLKGDVPQSIRGLLLPRTGCRTSRRLPGISGGTAAAREPATTGSCAKQRRSSKSKIWLPNLEIDALVDVMTFLAVEKRIASSLRERVQTTAETINADDVRNHRHPSGSPGPLGLLSVARLDGRTTAEALHAVYDALMAAADFYALRSLHKSGLRLSRRWYDVPGL